MMMATNISFPFDLTVNALTDWLETLGDLPHTQAAHQLTEILKQLKAEKIEQATLLPLLFSLTPVTLHLANNLANSAVLENRNWNKALKVGKLSMQLPRQLALLFCQITEDKALDAQTLSSCIYYASQLIGYSLRSYALFHEMPSTTLWRKLAELYRLAKTNACLNQTVINKIAEFKTQSSIASVIKRNLLFNIFSPNLFTTDEVNMLFQLANQAADLLVITDDHDTHNVGFYWDLDKDLPPYPVKKINRTLPEGFMAIDSQPISNALQLGSLSTQLSPSTQNKLALVLSSFHQIFSSIVPGLPSSSRMIHGFASACSYLKELNKLSRINELSSQLPGAGQMAKNLSLVPLEHQRNVFETPPQAFSKPKDMGSSVNILKTPSLKYIVAESRTLDCSTGDLALIYKEQHPISLVIIRQQKTNEISRLQQFLLEIIPGTCNIFNFVGSKIDTHGIVVGGNTSDPQIFLSYGKYNINTKLALNTGGSIYLKSHLESNTFFARFRFSWVDDGI